MRSRDGVTFRARDGVTSRDGVTLGRRDVVTSDVIGQSCRAAEVFQPRVAKATKPGGLTNSSAPRLSA